jgi:hypothetical protein
VSATAGGLAMQSHAATKTLRMIFYCPERF